MELNFITTAYIDNTFSVSICYVTIQLYIIVIYITVILVLNTIPYGDTDGEFIISDCTSGVTNVCLFQYYHFMISKFYTLIK